MKLMLTLLIIACVAAFLTLLWAPELGLSRLVVAKKPSQIILYRAASGEWKAIENK